MPEQPVDRGKTEHDASKSREEQIRDAIERIYRAYGSDLSAFQRDVQKELLRRSGGDGTEAVA